MHELERKAMEFATKAHEGQTRDDGATPYIEHPLKVVTTLKKYGVRDPEILAIAWLHDVAEDTEFSLDDIGDRFGNNIREGVWILTNESVGDWGEKISYEEKKFNMVVRIATHGWHKAAVVKLADRLCNLGDMKQWNRKRQNKYAARALGILWAVPRKHNPELWDALLKKVTGELLDGDRH
jgi:GTP pyrophosphokinase